MEPPRRLLQSRNLDQTIQFLLKWFPLGVDIAWISWNW